MTSYFSEMYEEGYVEFLQENSVGETFKISLLLSDQLRPRYNFQELINVNNLEDWINDKIDNPPYYSIRDIVLIKADPVNSLYQIFDLTFKINKVQTRIPVMPSNFFDYDIDPFKNFKWSKF